METLLNFAGILVNSMPLGIVVIALLFRKDINTLLGRIKEFKSSDVSVTFVEEKITRLEAEADRFTNGRSVSLSSGPLSAKTEEIARTSPAAAVIYAYAGLEKAIKEKISNIDPALNISRFSAMTQLLLTNRKIEPDFREFLNNLQGFRKDAGNITWEANPKIAVDYGKIIEQSIALVNAIPEHD
jgi:hypothetical protein